MSEPSDSYAAALSGVSRLRDEFVVEYREMLNGVRDMRLPLAACTIYDTVPGLSPAESVGLAIFNDAISKQVIAAGITLIDLRVVCNEPTDYSAASPIEPSAFGGGKIERAIYTALFSAENGTLVVG